MKCWKIMETEEKYLARYRNISWWKRNEFYNDLMKKMEYEYCRWYGSAYGLKHYDIQSLKKKFTPERQLLQSGRKPLLNQIFVQTWDYVQMIQFLRMQKEKLS